MKLATLKQNIGQEVKLTKYATGRFFSGSKFYIEEVNNSTDVRIKVQGQYTATYASITAKQISKILNPVESKPKIDTYNKESFSNEFKVLCSLRLASASIDSGYHKTNKTAIDKLKDAGLVTLNASHDTISVTTEGKKLIDKRFKSIIKAKTQFNLEEETYIVLKQYGSNTLIKNIKTGKEDVKSVELFTGFYSRIDKEATRIKELNDALQLSKTNKLLSMDWSKLIGEYIKIDTSVNNPCGWSNSLVDQTNIWKINEVTPSDNLQVQQSGSSMTWYIGKLNVLEVVKFDKTDTIRKELNSKIKSETKELDILLEKETEIEQSLKYIRLDIAKKKDSISNTKQQLREL